MTSRFPPIDIMAVQLTEPIAPQGMAPEVASYISQMIEFGHQEHDKKILAEMNSREKTMKGGMATLKAMTESLHSGAGEEFQKVKSEAEAFTKKMEAAEVEALARVEKFRENGNELDKKVVEDKRQLRRPSRTCARRAHPRR